MRTLRPSLHLILVLSVFAGIAACSKSPSPGTSLSSLTTNRTSVVPNGDFSQLDAAGKARSWFCFCADATKSCDVQNDAAATGKHVYLIPSGCRATNWHSGPATEQGGLRLQFEAMGAESDPRPNYSLRANGHSLTDVARAVASGTSAGWTMFSTEAVVTTVGFSLGVSFSNGGTETLSVRNVSVLSTNAPGTQVGSLIEAIHHDEFQVRGNSEHPELWILLPLDYSSQVPLFVDIEIKPQNVVHSFRYERDNVGNWGAVVKLRAMTDVARLTVDWRGLLMTRSISEEERPSVYAAASNRGLWTSSSAAIEADAADILAVSRGLADSTSPFNEMRNVIAWTSKNIQYEYVSPKFDASTVFAARKTTCTGFANLAAALARGMNLPTRVLGNILVGQVQQVHSINEVCCDPDSQS